MIAKKHNYTKLQVSNWSRSTIYKLYSRKYAFKYLTSSNTFIWLQRPSLLYTTSILIDIHFEGLKQLEKIDTFRILFDSKDSV